jgi:hypothetical protein
VGNSIRTPRQGKTANSKRIAEAVDDEEWQKFRVSLKGQSTRDKLQKLREYYNDEGHGCAFYEPHPENCDVCIRVDNYLKALARGGQLVSGVTLAGMIRDNWSSDWIIR